MSKFILFIFYSYPFFCYVLPLQGMGPLGWKEACQAGKTEALQRLLEKEEDPNQILDEHGHVALHSAAACLYTQSVRVLLKHNADPMAKCNLRVQTPLHALLDVGRCMYRAQRDLDGGFSGEQKIAKMCRIIWMLRKKGASAMFQDKQLNTSFHYAAGFNNFDVMASLLLPVQSEALKKQARTRFLCFLWVKKKRGYLGLTDDLVCKIFSFLPIDCFYGNLALLIKRGEIRDSETMENCFLKEAISNVATLLKEGLTSDEYKGLVKAYKSPNIHGKTPNALTASCTIKQLFGLKR